MQLAASNRVAVRSSIGTFLAACTEAAERSINEAIEEGAALSIAMAPSGAKDDPRTASLKDSIEPVQVSRTQGYWQCTARHALPVEKGGAAHEQTGKVSFFWEREGRMWEPGDNVIHHPGNPAQPYLRPAYEVIRGRMTDIMSRFYPG